MKKPKAHQPTSKFGNRKIWTIFGILVTLVITLFVFRGWVRMTVIPRTLGVFEADSIRKVFDNETEKLQNPIALLGYKSLENNKNNCETVIANGFSTQVFCYNIVQASTEISKASLSKENLNANAKKLQDLLMQNGWQQGRYGYTNDGAYMTLDKLVSSITAGIDYQPDATYEKQIGNVSCLFSSNTAFATPNPPAIATQFRCSRTFNIFGTPSY